jgi:hypothetical protein
MLLADRDPSLRRIVGRPWYHRKGDHPAGAPGSLVHWAFNAKVTMDEPANGLPPWLTIDLLIIVVTLTIILIWIWIDL